jgi:hypothetical protein
MIREGQQIRKVVSKKEEHGTNFRKIEINVQVKFM